MYDNLREEKLTADARREEAGYWDTAEDLFGRIGEAQARRLTGLMPHASIITGAVVPPDVPQTVVESLVECGATEDAGTPTLTFAGTYIIRYMGLMLEHEGMYGTPIGAN